MNSYDKFLEKDMEDLIILSPEKYIGESGLKLIKRQYSTKNYRFDLLFEDRHEAKLIIEIQRGTLDRNHTYKILDYYDEYKLNNPKDFVELMVIANRVTTERRERLNAHGISFREIPESVFLDDPNYKKYTHEKSKLRVNSSLKHKQKTNKANHSIGIIDTETIKKETNTLFRQNQIEINGADIYYAFQKSWNKDGMKDGIAYFSRSSNTLLVIPGDIVQQYLVNPIFEKSPTGYSYKNKYKDLEHNRGRINLQFIIEDDNLAVYIMPLKKHGILKIKIMTLTKKYWPQISTTGNLERKIINTIIELSRNKKDFENITIYQNLNQ